MVTSAEYVGSSVIPAVFAESSRGEYKKYL